MQLIGKNSLTYFPSLIYTHTKVSVSAIASATVSTIITTFITTITFYYHNCYCCYYCMPPPSDYFIMNDYVIPISKTIP